jgi:hypothetical protein
MAVVAVGRPGYTTPLKEMVAASVRRRAKQGMTQDISHLLYIVLTETLNFSSTKVPHDTHDTRHDTHGTVHTHDTI